MPLKAQYVQKSLRSHVEIKAIDAQAVGNGIIKATVAGQVILTGMVHGTAIQEVQPVTLEVSSRAESGSGSEQKLPIDRVGVFISYT